MRLNFKNLDAYDPEDEEEYVTVSWLRDKGDWLQENMWVLHEKAPPKIGYGLLFQPQCHEFSVRCDGDPSLLADRLQLERRAGAPIAWGTTHRTPEKIVVIDYICEAHSHNFLAEILAQAFEQRRLTDFLKYRVTYDDQSFLGLADVDQLVRRYFPKRPIQ